MCIMNNNYDVEKNIYSILFYSTLHQFSVSHGATSTSYPSPEVCTNLQFSLVKL